MPIVKPAWLTLNILNFQQIWGDQGAMIIYSEELKPLQYAIGQIKIGGVVSAGVASTVNVILM